MIAKMSPKFIGSVFIFQSPTPVNVFSGSSESDYLPAGNRSQKEKTHTVVPPTEVGGGSRFDFTVGTTTPSADKAEVIN